MKHVVVGVLWCAIHAACWRICSRRQITPALCTALAVGTKPACAASYQSGLTFQGGAGGLGKTKPEVGVVFAQSILDRATATQADGKVRAQLLTSMGMPVDVAFESPYKLSSSGVSTRDLSTGDSAFVVVAPRTTIKDAPLKVFSAEGKFGAYGAPTELKLVAAPSPDLLEFTFDALTPSMREVRRRVLVRSVPIDGDVFMLVAGSTAQRWKVAEPVARKAVLSFCVSPSSDLDAAMATYQKKKRSGR